MRIGLKTAGAAFATALALGATPARAVDEPKPDAAGVEGVTVAPVTETPSRAALVAIVRGEAAARGLPPDVAEAVAQIESGYQPSQVGGVGEIGLMQIRPSTAEMLGHTGGPIALFDPATNARYAVRYLADAWKLAGGDLCRALMKYRAGHNEERMSALSVAYCTRARAYLATRGSSLAGATIPAADFGVDTASAGSSVPFPVRRKGRPWTEADNDRFWAAQAVRIKALTAKIMRERAAKIQVYKVRFARRAGIKPARD
ncbi:lytic transglycosylase domain-containing protein [Hansschlegelia plantiphila]|uniref:Transglycosylase SLT domain-containing protein n=1 Tax=Hansschlegelia plantiphila TaxID=374655 RepID=A0A9W6MU44_9HYPH|nr:transglycosylase SLT domain-containing protein [Hansschlegelia plantiphila]GLK66493.1 hypothetical protein GCM10008179_01310 [Hansschlegelia plantiphila]